MEHFKNLLKSMPIQYEPIRRDLFKAIFNNDNGELLCENVRSISADEKNNLLTIWFNLDTTSYSISYFKDLINKQTEINALKLDRTGKIIEEKIFKNCKLLSANIPDYIYCTIDLENVPLDCIFSINN